MQNWAMIILNFLTSSRLRLAGFNLSLLMDRGFLNVKYSTRSEIRKRFLWGTKIKTEETERVKKWFVRMVNLTFATKRFYRFFLCTRILLGTRHWWGVGWVLSTLSM